MSPTLAVGTGALPTLVPLLTAGDLSAAFCGMAFESTWSFFVSSQTLNFEFGRKRVVVPHVLLGLLKKRFERVVVVLVHAFA
jgi:hypothetical protein